MEKPTYEELVALLKKCRPFVWRAMLAGKVPHEQDKIDAEELFKPLDEAIKNAVTPE